MNGQPTPTVAVPSEKAEQYELCRTYFTDGVIGISQSVKLTTLIHRGMRAWLMEEAVVQPQESQRQTSSQNQYDANDLVVIMASALGGVVGGRQ